MTSRPPTIGLVCSGGGARGAYEAGIIRYLREELPAASRKNVRFDVLTGTSIGATTCCFLAGTMHEPDEQGKKLEALWTNLKLEKVFKVEGESTWSVGRKIWKAARANERPEGWRLHDLLHPEPLENMVHESIPWADIAANLARGLVQAVSVTATRIRDGKAMVFVQKREPGLPPWSRDPHTEAVEVILGPEHALASASIPLLFRTAKIGDEYYCDGFVRQNTPLSPALRLGADRVLILSLRHRRSAQPVEVPRLPSAPTTLYVIGKILTALMVDRTDYDLDRLRRFNDMLERGRLAFGADFVEKMNAALSEARGQPYRIIRDLVVRPSRNLTDIAKPHLEARAKIEEEHPLPTRLLHRITSSQVMSQAELGSYLLFDGAYARDLVELGMNDAHQMREQFEAFFDPSAST